MSSPTQAIQLYDRMDLGKQHLRNTVQRQRTVENRREVAVNRKTYSQYTPVQDLNSQKRSYVNELKYARLQCMLEPHGRQRNLCFDRVANTARKLMRANSGSTTWPSR
jgi:hypothetical protein